MVKWISRKLGLTIAAGVVILARPEVALYATILGCVAVAVFGAVDLVKALKK